MEGVSSTGMPSRGWSPQAVQALRQAWMMSGMLRVGSKRRAHRASFVPAGRKSSVRRWMASSSRSRAAAENWAKAAVIPLHVCCGGLLQPEIPRGALEFTSTVSRAWS